MLGEFLGFLELEGECVLLQRERDSRLGFCLYAEVRHVSRKCMEILIFKYLIRVVPPFSSLQAWGVFEAQQGDTERMRHLFQQALKVSDSNRPIP